MSQHPPTSPNGPALTVHAEPTKEFFVNMLVRDIDLLDAVVDLLDNSVDGARRVANDNDFKTLSVKVSFGRDRFLISDNCGGIDLSTARQYAFRFGRPRDREPQEWSVGEFGVGMKRTLFKLGRRFSVESRTRTTSFRLEVDVDEWEESETWDFPLQQSSEVDQRPLSDTGTTITVTSLSDEVTSDFAEPQWVRRFIEDVRLKHRLALARGLTITVNDQDVTPVPLTLKSAPGRLQPLEELHTYERQGVNLRLLTGIADHQRSAAGWYIFCNDRLILGPDRTSATVWEGAGRHARGSIPAYHDQYDRFRGLAFFTARNPDNLPWTTTKTGVSVDSPVWREARVRMIRLTRPWIDFLNEVDKERTASDALPEEAGLEIELANDVIDEAPAVDIDAVTAASSLVLPQVNLAALPKPKVWIRYAKDADEFDRARDLARDLLAPDGVADLKPGDVGQLTFDYFMRNEGGE